MKLVIHLFGKQIALQCKSSFFLFFFPFPSLEFSEVSVTH